ncbi:2-hydroxyacid dehydrogenase [Pilimelia anulata]|uniref:2-hydroxyacid dehydrogenase n=1 Tax=Pilimelia anulata TaxID=53371 RepID=UPI00166F1F4D|nr:2-hydroxyacid dehydrogenase [Pilimelia anulata]
MKAWLAHPDGIDLIGGVPAGVAVEVVTDPADPPSDPAGVTFWTPPYLVSSPAWTAFAASLPDLRVIQLLTAGADAWLGRVPAGVTLCDGRGIHDAATADWAVAATLAKLRRFDDFARAQARADWSYRAYAPTDELTGKRVLVVGAGAIGTGIGARLAPFGVPVTYAARTARPGVHGVGELPDLLPRHDVVILIVPLTAATRGLVDAGFLAAMPDGALLVNAARGPVVDTAALTKELATGRLRAALDVTDPEPLPADHPLWAMPNVLLTPHVAGAVRGMPARAYALAGEQLRRHAAGEALANVVHDDY